MPLFKKKTEIVGVTCVIPGWEDSKFSSLLREWAYSSGLSENRGGKHQNARPLQVTELLKMVPVKKGMSCTGWVEEGGYYCLLTGKYVTSLMR